MSEVTFEEEASLTAPRLSLRNSSERLVTWMVEKKLAATVDQANLMLVGVALFCFFVALLVLFSGDSSAGPPSTEERAILEASTPLPRR